MENSKLQRINELARIKKDRELTAEETAERDALRKEYLDEWRKGAIEVLENTYIQTPDGKKHKLQRKDKNDGIFRLLKRGRSDISHHGARMPCKASGRY